MAFSVVRYGVDDITLGFDLSGEACCLVLGVVEFGKAVSQLASANE